MSKCKYLDFTTGNELLDQGIELYLMHGYEPGGFLQAVLANDLFLAASRADYNNKQNLASIAQTVYHNMPAGSIGNYDLVRDWLKDTNGRRSSYAYQKEREFIVKSLKGEVNEAKFQDPPF